MQKISEAEYKKIIKRPGYSVTVAPVTDEKKPSAGSELEQRFLAYWTALEGPELEREYKFHPTRKWRADFVHKLSLTAIEIEGRGHNRQNRYTGDLAKYNEYAYLGWSLIRLTSTMITKDQLQRLIDYIKERMA